MASPPQAVPDSRPRRVVVLSFDTLGDLVLRQPFFAALLESGYRVTVAVRRGYARMLPFLDPRLEALVTDLNPYSPQDDSFPAEAERLRAAIADVRLEILVCALYDRTSLDDSLLRQLEGIETVGFAPGPFTRTAACDENAPEIEKNAALLRAVSGGDISGRLPRLSLPDPVAGQAAAIVEKLGLTVGRYVLGCPAGTANIGLKAWTPESYAELVEHLGRRHGLPVLIAGVESEAPLMRRVVAAAADRGVTVPMWVGAADDLGTLLGLIRHSRLYLGSDTGPMHFAAALGVPVVAQFGGGHWPRFVPAAARSFVATQKLPCFGCGWECWLDEPCCITLVRPDAFKAGIDWILSDAPDARRVDLGAEIDPLSAKVLASARKAKVGPFEERIGRLEAESVARLDVIRRLEADGTARLDVIERLIADGAARLDAIHRLTAALQESEADRAARLEVINGLKQRLDEQQQILDRRAVRLLRKVGIA